MWNFLNPIFFLLVHLCVLCLGFRFSFSDRYVPNCGNNGYNYDSRTGHCYKFHNHMEPWRAAARNCRSEGARLAVVNSDAEMLLLRQLFATYPPAAILGAAGDGIGWPNVVAVGIYYADAGWMTVDGQTLLQAGYPQWYNGLTHPFGVMRRDGKTFNVPSNHQQPFICEKAPY